MCNVWVHICEEKAGFAEALGKQCCGEATEGYPPVAGVLFVYDVTNPSSLQQVMDTHNCIASLCAKSSPPSTWPGDMPLLMFTNKCDTPNINQTTLTRGIAFAQIKGIQHCQGDTLTHGTGSMPHKAFRYLALKYAEKNKVNISQATTDEIERFQ